MKLKNKNVIFALTGSFCNFNNVILEMKELVKENVNIIPIMSYMAYKTDTRFGKAKDFIEEIERICGKKILHTNNSTEEYIRNNLINIMIVAPCTGNTIAKLSNGICDSPVLLAVRTILKDNKPIVIGISTPDGLSTNAENIGSLLNKKDYFFVPFRQSNPITKPYSISSDFKYIKKTLEYALDKEQIQPILV